MDLWIKSQDKTELVKIEEICISIDNDGFVGVWSYGSNKHLKYFLGSYKTKERALEVLDEIQRHLVVINDKNDNLFYVYEMPKD